MSRIVFAWEFGAGMGHLGYFLPVAVELRRRGHDIRFAVTQTGSAARLLAQAGFSWFQAPTVAERPAADGRMPLSYADIMLRFGYHDSDDLNGLVTAWREIFKLAQTDLVVADHSPTALVAARSLGLPIMLYGSGFFIPPRLTPLPNMRYWNDIPAEKLLAIEAEMLVNINRVLILHGQTPLATLADLFDVAEDAILSFPELDHYPQRGAAKYWGVVPNAGVGATPTWPNVPGPRLFAYLRPQVRHFEAALAALRSIALPTIAYCPDVSREVLARYAAPNLRFSDTMLDMNRLAAEADATVNYAAYASTLSFLLAGKPVLMLPFHLEQFMFARRVEEMGAGLLVGDEQTPDVLPGYLTRIAHDAHFRGNARAFAAKYSHFTQEFVVGNIVRRIEEIIQ